MTRILPDLGIDATPLTLGQEWSGYAGMLSDDLERIEAALQGVYQLALGGWERASTQHRALPKRRRPRSPSSPACLSSPRPTNSPRSLVQLSGTLRTLAVSLYKIANDIRLMSCGPRPGFAELDIPENEPGFGT